MDNLFNGDTNHIIKSINVAQHPIIERDMKHSHFFTFLALFLQ